MIGTSNGFGLNVDMLILRIIMPYQTSNRQRRKRCDEPKTPRCRETCGESKRLWRLRKALDVGARTPQLYREIQND